MNKNDTKVPLKLSILGFRLDTTITKMSFLQVLILIVMGMFFVLALVILLREYAITAISISAIIDKLSKLEILKIIKSRAP